MMMFYRVKVTYENITKFSLLAVPIVLAIHLITSDLVYSLFYSVAVVNGKAHMLLRSP
jgi:hypothetical protein